MWLLIVNCILLALVYQFVANPATPPCSDETDSDTKSKESSSGSKTSSHGSDSDDPKYQIVINIKDITEEGGSSKSSSSSDGCPECKHPNKAYFDETCNKCKCTFDGTFPKCCPNCTVTNGAECDEKTEKCECTLGGEFPKCCPDCSAVAEQICCEPDMDCGSANVGDCFCKFGVTPKSDPIECCLEQCPDGQSCKKDGYCSTVDCQHPNGAYYDDDSSQCECTFDGTYENCCPDCTETNGAVCDEQTGNCKCEFGGELPNCCPDCSAIDQVCCKPDINCGSANVGDCFCEFGEIPRDDNTIECCPTNCPTGEACDKNGDCKPVLPFGALCEKNGLRSSNACDRQAGIKCHTYDCCSKPNDNVRCNEKYCLCETPEAGCITTTPFSVYLREAGHPNRNVWTPQILSPQHQHHNDKL